MNSSGGSSRFRSWTGGGTEAAVSMFPRAFGNGANDRVVWGGEAGAETMSCE